MALAAVWLERSSRRWRDLAFTVPFEVKIAEGQLQEPAANLGALACVCVCVCVFYCIELYHTRARLPLMKARFRKDVAEKMRFRVVENDSDWFCFAEWYAGATHTIVLHVNLVPLQKCGASFSTKS